MGREDNFYVASLLIAEKAVSAKTNRSCSNPWAAVFAFAYARSMVKIVLLAPHDQAVQEGHVLTLVGPSVLASVRRPVMNQQEITGSNQEEEEEEAQDIADLEEPGLVAASQSDFP